MSEYTMAKTFKEFQRRNHCSQLHPDDMEKWLWEMIEENTQLKAALTNIQAITDNNYDHDMLRIAKLAKGAMENRG